MHVDTTHIHHQFYTQLHSAHTFSGKNLIVKSRNVQTQQKRRHSQRQNSIALRTTKKNKMIALSQHICHTMF